jgi:hypothetical protein
MGRLRTKDKHLPGRVYYEHGRYWFKPKKPDPVPPDWKPRIDLGTTLAEMYEALKNISRSEKPLHTMGELFDKYLLEVLPTLALRTQSDYRGYIERIRPVLASWEPGEVTAGDVFDIRAAIANESGNTQANRHASCLSAIFREAIGWRCGVVVNPCHELKRLSEPPRTRYVFDHEYTGVYGVASPMLQCAMDLATITGQREDDLLKLPYDGPDVYTDEGIVFRPAKSKRRHPRHGKIIETSKIVIVRWLSEEEAESGLPREASSLWKLVARLRKLGPQPPDNVIPIRPRPTLICNEDGQPYTGSGFRSNWHRLIQTSLKGRKRKNGVVTLEPVLKESFTFNDLRAKNATDEEDFEEAHNRLAHSDRKTTQMVYVRKPRRARAGRKVG